MQYSHFKEVGKVLSTFPKKIPSEYSLVIDINQPGDKTPYFVLRAYTRDNQGHTALQVKINNKKDSPEDGECCFSMVAEKSGIQRFGKLIQKFADSKYRLLRWSSPNPDNDILLEWEHRDSFIKDLLENLKDMGENTHPDGYGPMPLP